MKSSNISELKNRKEKIFRRKYSVDTMTGIATNLLSFFFIFYSKVFIILAFWANFAPVEFASVKRKFA